MQIRTKIALSIKILFVSLDEISQIPETWNKNYIAKQSLNCLQPVHT